MQIENNDVSSIERHKRRSWTGDEKRRIVEESLEPGVSIAKVARRYNLNANQLDTWRRQQGVSTITLHNSGSILPVTLNPETLSSTEDSPGASGQMEIVLAEGDRIIVWSDFEVAALSRAIKALRS
jgi:transposase